MIRFTIPLEPIGQMRARSRAIRSKSGKVIATTYKAKKQRRHEAQLMQLLEQYVPDTPIECAVSVKIQAHFSPPKSKPKWWFEVMRSTLMAHTKKPDIDNIAKHMLDCMTRMGFWRDDTQVSELHVSKHVSDKPRWEVEIAQITVHDRMSKP